MEDELLPASHFLDEVKDNIEVYTSIDDKKILHNISGAIALLKEAGVRLPSKNDLNTHGLDLYTTTLSFIVLQQINHETYFPLFESRLKMNVNSLRFGSFKDG